MAEDRPERVHAVAAAIDRAFVEIGAEQVDAVRAGQVVEDVAVEIGRGDARGRFEERADRQALAHQPAELERHAIALGELQIGDEGRHLGGERQRAGKALPVERGEALEIGAALCRDLIRRAVGGKEARIVIAVEWHQRGDAARHARMAGERRVLRPRQLQARFEFDGCGGDQGERAGRVERNGRDHLIHRCSD